MMNLYGEMARSVPSVWRLFKTVLVIGRRRLQKGVLASLVTWAGDGMDATEVSPRPAAVFGRTHPAGGGGADFNPPSCLDRDQFP